MISPPVQVRDQKKYTLSIPFRGEDMGMPNL